jgi:hypothetical protein
MFNRHEILKTHYIEEIRGWDWERIKSLFDKNSNHPDCYEIQEDDKYVYLYVGGVCSMVPSGKYYTFWTTNQTRRDETHDAAWWEALEQCCEEFDCFPSQPDGCGGDDIFLCKRYAMEEEDEEN